MDKLKFILTSLILTTSFTLSAQDEISNKKAERLEKKTERKELREERREERKEKKKEPVELTYGELESEEIGNNNIISSEEEQPTTKSPSTTKDETVTNSKNHTDNNTIDDRDINVEEPKKKQTTEQKSTNQTEVKQAHISTQSDSTSESAEDELDVLLLLLLLIVIGIYKVIKFIFARRCSSCKRKFSMRVVNEEFLGHTKKTREKGSDGKHYKVYYSRIKVTRQCKHCGHMDFYIEERKDEI